MLPSGNVSVCANETIALTCVTTERTLIWVTTTGNQFFDQEQAAPVVKGDFNLVVNSAVSENAGNGVTLLRVNSTATVYSFQPALDGISIECREFMTGADAVKAVLKDAGKLFRFGHVCVCTHVCVCVRVCV